MRWFVEVSRVGDDDSAERYCIEAKAWQAALQEARKLRGDSGPLSKFSIELLDGGYRAIDPVRKIRYVVNQAPADAPLQPPLAVNGAAHAPAGSSAPKAAPEQASARPDASAPPDARPSAASGAPVREEPRPGAPPAAASPVIARPTASSAPAPAASRPAPAPSMGATPAPSVVRSPSAPPAAQQPGLGAGSPAMAARQPAPVARSQPAPAAAKALTSSLSAGSPAPVVTGAQVPPFGIASVSSPAVIEKERPPGRPRASVPAPSRYRRSFYRHEDPRPETPLAYREEVYVVEAGTSLPAVEALLAEQFEAVQQELAGLPPGKLVRLAVFDVEFQGPAPRPPLGVLAWKDWHPEPSVGFPAFGIEAPVLTSSLPPRSEARRSEPTAASRASAPNPPAATPASPSPAPAVRAAEPERGAPEIIEPPSSSGTFYRSDAPPKGPSGTPAAPPASSPRNEAAPGAAAPAVAVAGPPADAAPASPASRIEPARAPELQRPQRRRAREDLVSELFERLHELRFATDLVTGADFVLDVLAEVIPSELGMVQVFDINTRSFVVVRTRGGTLAEALLHRTPDTDPLVEAVMRRSAPVVFRAEDEPRLAGGRWAHAGTPLGWVLSGGVRQGGRYLGMIELANPEGGTPFEDTEINAFDYACAQFADLVATRPVVLDREIILAR